MVARLLVVVSGLPASGKTTVGRQLSEALCLPLLDKDVVLEGLFDSLGCGDRVQRERLSRASDEIVLRLAGASTAAVVVNWWNQDTAPARLVEAADTLVEVFCDCPFDLAAARFGARERHPGHLDSQRTPEERDQGLQRLRDTYRGALRLGGPLITADTGRALDVEALVEAVRAAIDCHES